MNGVRSSAAHLRCPVLDLEEGREITRHVLGEGFETLDLPIAES
jgi:hypothetical protein